jgi:hypothetical protein
VYCFSPCIWLLFSICIQLYWPLLPGGKPTAVNKIIPNHIIIHVPAIYRLSEGDVSTKVHQWIRYDVTIYRYINTNIIAVMVLTYSWLKFSDKPLFTCVCWYVGRIHRHVMPTFSIQKDHLACKCGYNSKSAQYHVFQATRTHVYGHYAHSVVSPVQYVLQTTSVVLRMMKSSCICYAHAHCDRWSYVVREGRSRIYFASPLFIP